MMMRSSPRTTTTTTTPLQPRSFYIKSSRRTRNDKNERGRLRCKTKAITSATNNSNTNKLKIFKGGKDEIKLGARENLLYMIETKNDVGVESALEELKTLYDGEIERPAKSRLLEGKWKLLWSKQTSGKVNPFQKLFAGLAKDTNFQIVEENGARVVNDVEVAKFLRVKAIARSSAASDVRTNVTIDTVDINLFGKKVKTITLEPSPGKGIGYVEQLYLDDKVRISVGNKGSIFVHERVGTYDNGSDSDDDENDENDSSNNKKEERSLALV